MNTLVERRRSLKNNKIGENMNTKMFYFLLGFLSMTVISIYIVSKYPAPPGDMACGKCGSYEWYFKIAEN